MTAIEFEELPPLTNGPMAGWQAFGAILNSRRPLVRSLGGVEDWPDGELANGVAHIQIELHGDSVSGAFLQVTGPDRSAVEATFTRAAFLVLSGATAALFPDGAA